MTSPLASNPKFIEAQEHVKAAEKSLTTSFFKRKPDYETAASEFESAATTFRYIKAYEESLQATLRASEAQYKSESIYMSAKSMETAGQLAVNHLKRVDEGVGYYTRSSQLFRQINSVDRAIEVLEKAAKAVEPWNLELALPLYEDACSLYDDEDKGMMAVETYKKTISTYLKLKQVEKALTMVDRLSDILQKIQNKHLLCKNYLSSIILMLQLGDEVGANKKYQEYVQSDGFLRSDEGDIACALLNAFEKRNQNDLKEVLKRQQLGFLDNEIVKVSRTLKVIGADLEIDPSQSVHQQAPQATTSLCDDIGNAPVEEKGKDETSELC